ncbi:hypothetical protein IPN35_00450 [Candidatus Peregrinibacteria bacterium]|nr:MAG: hypothetical protein IPN35_00450 [Candidatus Peregrinibacteria bacterium]
MIRILFLFAIFLLPFEQSLASGICDFVGTCDPPDLIPIVPSDITPVEKVTLVVLAFLRFVFYGIGIGAVVMIVIAGVRLTFSFGGEEQVTAAKSTLLYAVIGLFAVILSVFLVQVVTDFLLNSHSYKS